MKEGPCASELIDGHTHVGVDVLFYLRGHYPYALDWPSLVRQGRSNGIGRFVVFPMVSHLALDLPGMSGNRVAGGGRWEHVPYAFENRRLMEEIMHRFPEFSDLALPLWMVDPSREQKAQVEALRGLKEEFRCFGLKIQASITQSYISDLLGGGECLLDLAEGSGWPILIHTSVHPQDPWSQVGDILGVVRKRPGIRFCLAHSCRFDTSGLDAVAELSNAWFDCSAHRIHCRLAAADSPVVAPAAKRFATDYHDPARVLHDLAERYPGKLIWGSDAPFESYVDDDIRLKSSYKEETDALRQLDEGTVQTVALKNPMNFLKI